MWLPIGGSAGLGVAWFIGQGVVVVGEVWGYWELWKK